MFSEIVKYAAIGAAVVLAQVVVRGVYKALPRLVEDSSAEARLDAQINQDYERLKDQLSPADRARLEPSRYWASRRAPAAV